MAADHPRRTVQLRPHVIESNARVARRAHLVDQLAALAAYGQPDDDPRVTAARTELAALDDVDQVDAPASAPTTRRARRGTARTP